MNATPYDVTVNIEPPFSAEEDAVRAAAEYTLSLLQIDACALSVTLTSAEQVHQLNREYADNDYVTDVLSFAAEDDPYDVEPGDPPYIGDIIIAVPVAEKQAEEAGHSLLAEIQTLTVHGSLHLLGFDHQNPEQQAEMWAYQSAVLDALRAAGYG